MGAEYFRRLAGDRQTPRGYPGGKQIVERNEFNNYPVSPQRRDELLRCKVSEHHCPLPKLTLRHQSSLAWEAFSAFLVGSQLMFFFALPIRFRQDEDSP